MCWDIGGKKGLFLRLQGHQDIPINLTFKDMSLYSIGSNGGIVRWDMTKQRSPPPEWTESDSCEVNSSARNQPLFFAYFRFAKARSSGTSNKCGRKKQWASVSTTVENAEKRFVQNARATKPSCQNLASSLSQSEFVKNATIQYPTLIRPLLPNTRR